MILPLFLDTDDCQFFDRDARAAITEVCAATAAEVRRLLPELPSIIEVAAQTGTSVIAETGEAGAVLRATRIRWIVDPTRPGGIAVIARAQLRATLFHELHHVARGWVIESGKARTSFMDAVVSEGLATAFERDAAGRRSPWGEYPEDVAAWVEELLGLPRDAPYRTWMFKHTDGRQWVGYRAGTYIVDQAKRVSGLSAARMVKVPTREILAMAGLPI